MVVDVFMYNMSSGAVVVVSAAKPEGPQAKAAHSSWR
jgi:hypothetical protein